MGISAYSMVRLAGGGEKRAEDIAAGDVLEGPGGQAVTVAKVWQGPAVGMCRVSVAGGMLDLTGDQRLLTPAGPAAAGDIRPGALIRTQDGDAPCAGVEALPGDFMVYDIVAGESGATVIANRLAVVL